MSSGLRLLSNAFKRETVRAAWLAIAVSCVPLAAARADPAEDDMLAFVDTLCIAPRDRAAETPALANRMGLQELPANAPGMPPRSRAWSGDTPSGALLIGLPPDGSCLVFSVTADFDRLNAAILDSGSARLLNETSTEKMYVARFQRGLSRPVREQQLSIVRAPAAVAIIVR